MSQPTSKNTRPRGLGKGVEALFLNEDTLSQSQTPEVNDGGIQTISVKAIIPGRYQPRKSFNDKSAKELTESVRLHGVLQPIIVRYLAEDQKYEIIAGERRWRASTAADLDNIPAVIRNVSDQQMIFFGLIENLQRDNLNCLEEAEGIARIVSEFNITHEKAAEILSKSRSAITNSLRLLDLTNPIKAFLRNGQLEMGHARALLPLTSAQQKALAQITIDHHLSVREVERRAKKLSQPHEAKKNNKTPSNQDNEYETFLSQLEEQYALPINVAVDKSGKGFLKFQFSKKEQLLSLLNRLNSP